MAPKKKNEPQPAAAPLFRTNPFAALKGVQLESAAPPPPPEAPKKVTVQKQEPSAEALFRQAMSGVRPLEGEVSSTKKTGTHKKPATQAAPTPAKSPAKPLPRDEVVARRTFLHEVEKLQLDVRFQDQLPEEEELRPLSGNRLRQLKRGIIELERQLDLHGLTREEALAALGPFLQAARLAGEKAVLVITGKGRHSAEGPVLQQVVAGWLRDQGREMISEYAPAPQEMGGSGAFVIFLRPLDKPA